MTSVFVVYEDGSSPESRLSDFLAARSGPVANSDLIAGRLAMALVTDEGFALLLAARESELVYRGFSAFGDTRSEL